MTATFGSFTDFSSNTPQQQEYHFSNDSSVPILPPLNIVAPAQPQHLRFPHIAPSTNRPPACHFADVPPPPRSSRTCPSPSASLPPSTFPPRRRPCPLFSPTTASTRATRLRGGSASRVPRRRRSAITTSFRRRFAPPPPICSTTKAMGERMGTEAQTPSTTASRFGTACNGRLRRGPGHIRAPTSLKHSFASARRCVSLYRYYLFAAIDHFSPSF